MLISQPVINSRLAFGAVEWLNLEPLPPVFAALAAIAFAAGWHEVAGDGVATFVARLDVIQRVGRGVAIGAAVLPCLKDLLPESLLCGALGDEGCAINLMIHATPGLVGR